MENTPMSLLPLLFGRLLQSLHPLLLLVPPALPPTPLLTSTIVRVLDLPSLLHPNHVTTHSHQDNNNNHNHNHNNKSHQKDRALLALFRFFLLLNKPSQKSPKLLEVVEGEMGVVLPLLSPFHPFLLLLLPLIPRLPDLFPHQLTPFPIHFLLFPLSPLLPLLLLPPLPL